MISELKLTSPLFSVITPCFNYAHLLAETLDSLVAQSYTEWECLILDDASTDSTRALSESYARHDERFRVLSNSVNRGPSASRNTGIFSARGRYLFFLDADDLLGIDALQRLADAIATAGGQQTLIYCIPWCYFEGKQERRRTGSICRVDGLGQDRQHNLLVLSKNPLPVCAGIIDRRLAIEIGGFDTALRSLEDYDLWMRLAAQGATFRYLEGAGRETACMVRFHADSHSVDTLKMYQSEIKLRNEWVEKRFLDGIPKALADNRKRRVNRRARMLLLQLFTRGEREQFGSVWRGLVLDSDSRSEILVTIARAATGLLIDRIIGNAMSRSLRRFPTPMYLPGWMKARLG